MISFIKAKIRSGAGWLLARCVILSVVILSYFWLHVHYTGTDHKKLDTQQLSTIDNILSENPDPVTVALKPDTSYKAINAQRAQRDKRLAAFLQNEFDNQMDLTRWAQLDTVLTGLNNKDAKLYLTNQEIIVKDFFWFTGRSTYLEVLLWALIGVLVSLIYYVSLANGQAAKTTDEEDGDIGPFDSSEISGQVAKMFYAPICALVLVLGYSLLNSDNKMTDISMGKGLLLFSFICGFFSGRVMKFIDRLKDLVLPVSSSSSTGATGSTNGTDGADSGTGASGTNGTATEATGTTSDNNIAETANTGNTVTAETANGTGVTVSLQLAPEVAQSADGPDIVEGGFNTAVVTLQPAAGGSPITLAVPSEDQGANFTAKQVPSGKYTLQASMAYKNTTTVINLSASEAVEVSGASNSFELQLDKTAVSG